MHFEDFISGEPLEKGSASALLPKKHTIAICISIAVVALAAISVSIPADASNDAGLVAINDSDSSDELILIDPDATDNIIRPESSLTEALFPNIANAKVKTYAVGKQIPYQRGIVKYTPTWPRSFTPSNQAMRELVAKMKLIPNKTMLNGKKVVFCDDSIVRGTQLRDNVSDLYRYGAREVHMRISCPPLLYPCKFLNFTASKSEMELITRRTIAELEGDPDKNIEAYARTHSPQYNCMVNCICKKLKITSLKFNPLETLVESIGLPKECICTHCFDGSSYE